MKPTFRNTAAALIVATAPTFAQASPEDGGWPGAGMIRADSWYIGAGGGIDYMKLPRYDANIFTVGNRPVLNFEPKVVAGGPDATLGYIFRDGTMPAWMGRNVRLEFGFLYRTGRKTSTETSQATQAGAIFQVDGTSTAFGFGLTGSAQGALTADHNRWQVSLTARSDYKIRPGWIISPFVSVHGGIAETDYEGRFRSFVATRVAGTVFQDSLLFENARTWHVGMTGGAKLVWKIRLDLRVYAGGFAGVMWQRSRYNGTSCQGANSTLLNSCAGNLVARGNASDAASRLGFVGGVTAGVRYRLGPVIVALSGTFTYMNAMPGIRHPSPANAAAASLDHKGGYRFSGGLRLIIPFSTGG